VRHTGALERFFVSGPAAEGLEVTGEPIEADFVRWPG